MNASSSLKIFPSPPPPLISSTSTRPTAGQPFPNRKSPPKLSNTIRCTNLNNFGPKSNPNPKTHDFPVSSATTTVSIEAPFQDTTADKLRLLVSEFRSLPEPIDRVKRLLNYASALAPLDDSARVPANKVTGCTTQVWLEIKIDEFGRVRFRADSDSEISKGFCSCLIWILDGAKPDEVMGVKGEDLMEMNVGVHGKVQSRVNTWHNVLMSMQKRTMALVVDARADVAHWQGDRHTPPQHGLLLEYVNGRSYMESSSSNLSLLPLHYDFTI